VGDRTIVDSPRPRCGCGAVNTLCCPASSPLPQAGQRLLTKLLTIFGMGLSQRHERDHSGVAWSVVWTFQLDWSLLQGWGTYVAGWLTAAANSTPPPHVLRTKSLALWRGKRFYLFWLARRTGLAREWLQQANKGTFEPITNFRAQQHSNLSDKKATPTRT